MKVNEKIASASQCRDLTSIGSPYPHRLLNPRAFTMIELLIVMMILAVTLTVSLSSVRSARTNARLDEAVRQTVSLIQTARVKALGQIELELEGDYYLATDYQIKLDASSTPITLTLYASVEEYSEDSVALETVTLHNSIQLEIEDPSGEDTLTLTYVPPNAELSFDPEPSASTVEFTLTTDEGVGKQTLTVSEIAGIPEIVE